MLGFKNISAPPRGSPFFQSARRESGSSWTLPTRVSASRRIVAARETERLVFGRKFPRRSFIIAAVVVLLAVAIGGVTLVRGRGAATVAQVPFSDLLRHLDSGSVKEVVVNGDTLEFKLANAQTFRTIAPANYVTTNAAFVPDLAKKGVRIDVQTITDQSPYSYGALLLGLGFVGLLGFAMYRVTSGRIPALESKAREAGEEGTTVTFADVAGVDEAKEEVK